MYAILKCVRVPQMELVGGICAWAAASAATLAVATSITPSNPRQPDSSFSILPLKHMGQSRTFVQQRDTLDVQSVSSDNAQTPALSDSSKTKEWANNSEDESMRWSSDSGSEDPMDSGKGDSEDTDDSVPASLLSVRTVLSDELLPVQSYTVCMNLIQCLKFRYFFIYLQ